MIANNKFFAKIPLFYNMTILCVTLFDNISFINTITLSITDKIISDIILLMFNIILSVFNISKAKSVIAKLRINKRILFNQCFDKIIDRRDKYRLYLVFFNQTVFIVFA